MLLRICLVFCQFEHGIAYKSVAYKKSVYFTIEEAKLKLSGGDCNSFSVFHPNIRTLQKNFDKVIHFLSALGFEFRLICISETRCSV